MATEKQKRAARQNLEKARAAQSARAQGKRVPRRSEGMSTAEQNDLAANEFAFPGCSGRSSTASRSSSTAPRPHRA
jgi:hypothetical protein